MPCNDFYMMELNVSIFEQTTVNSFRLVHLVKMDQGFGSKLNATRAQLPLCQLGFSKQQTRASHMLPRFIRLIYSDSRLILGIAHAQ